MRIIMDDPITTNSQKAHNSLLREELVLLRHYLDLHLDRSRVMLERACAKKPKILGQNIPGSNIKDLLLVSIDIENTQAYRTDKLADYDGQYQVGLSILDTRDLQSRVTNPEHGSDFSDPSFLRWA
jgi:hypothetical protein